MTKRFEIRAVCAECDTPVDGKYKRGNLYYCSADFQRTSPQEKAENMKQERKLIEFKKLVS